jgi:hypothetical protein
VTFALADQSAVDGHRIVAVSYLEPELDGDSGFCFFAGEPDERDDGGVVHLECIFSDDPTVGEGMKLARENGLAVRRGDNWVLGQ